MTDDETSHGELPRRRMGKARIALLLFAILAVALSLFNASWLAGSVPGRMVLLANRGIVYAPRDGASGPCASVDLATQQPRYIENTVPALRMALTLGASGVAVDLRRTADNRMVAFRDETVDCRTQATGAIAAMPLAQVKQLDAGYRYTGDEGASFPLRGFGTGMIPTLEELLYTVPNVPLVFVLHGDAADAEAIAAEFARAGLRIDDARYGFVGDEAALARVRTLAPKAWTYSKAASDACLSGYRASGWIGIVPEACRGATVAVVPGANWTLWGWPFRFLSRLSGVGGRAMLAGSYDEAGRPTGLTSKDQIDDVPSGFNGPVWIEDMTDVGAAIRR